MLAVRALEDQGLRDIVVRKIIPFVCRVIEDLDVLCDEVIEDDVSRRDVRLPVHGPRIADGKRPVIQGPFDRLPQT